MVCPLTCVAASAAPRADGQLVIDVVDSDTQQPIAARMHLKNVRGRPVKLRLPAEQQFADHFYIDGQITLPLARGQYTFEIDAGPEYRPQTGHFEIDRHADDQKTIEMRRAVDLAKEDWWAGDLDVLRKPDQLPLAQRAEAIAVAPTRERPSDGPAEPLLKFEDRVIARTPFDWDFPVWLARGELDAIQVITPHQLRDDVVDNEGDGRPRDRLLFPGRTGNGRWAEMVYFQVLNCGLRIPPAAGSGTGENDNPLGTNRVYVYCDDEFTPNAWWEGLEAGRVFATNGPLLRTRVHGEPPGYVFRLGPDEHLKFEIGLNLATREPVEYLEIIKNGAIEREERLDKWAAAGGRLPALEFDDSGWFLVRAVTTNTKKYQLAISGPYYVERAGRPRVSRASVQFFLDWIDAATAHWRDAKNLDASTRATKLAEQAQARQFFAELLATANAD
jgi:hypothetical protein